MADVFAGRAEDLSVDVDQPLVPTMPRLPSDRPGDRVSACFPDPLVQVEVAHWMRDDR